MRSSRLNQTIILRVLKDLMVLYTEIYESLKNLYPSYTSDIFQFSENNRPVRSQKKKRLSIQDIVPVTLVKLADIYHNVLWNT